ncbi:MAG TPA: hypothetical protein VJS64_08965 [Pyrinomonadaceae bacterium]|nr:hypothetical protein [Pyrinomonadaceae bacterium]
MSISVLRLFVIAVVLLVVSGVTLRLDSASAKQRTTKVGQEFSIKVGEQVNLEGADLALKFVGVPQDSRCPSNVNCVWAGNAEVAVELVHNKCTSALTLNTHSRPPGGEGKVGSFSVKLVKLDPYPHTEKKISPSDYVATFLVAKE